MHCSNTFITRTSRPI